MLRLQSFPLKEPRNIQKLRREADAAPANKDVRIALALALSRAGCTTEAASILRPLRSHWKTSEQAPLAQAAVDAQAWWNKNWKAFVALKRSGKTAAALALLGDRATHYWDLPPLLVHLGEIASDDDQLDLASHLFRRVFHLSERGVPGMKMEAFAYVAQAALADLLCTTGDAAAALESHRGIVPNPGNAMAHEIQHARLLVAAGHLDDAMQTAASNSRDGNERPHRLQQRSATGVHQVLARPRTAAQTRGLEDIVAGPCDLPSQRPKIAAPYSAAIGRDESWRCSGRRYTGFSPISGRVAFRSASMTPPPPTPDVADYVNDRTTNSRSSSRGT